LGSSFNHDDAWQEWPPGDVAGHPKLVRSNVLHANGLGVLIIHPYDTIDLSHVSALWQERIKLLRGNMNVGQVMSSNINKGFCHRGGQDADPLQRLTTP
jgi:hypothetical protein